MVKKTDKELLFERMGQLNPEFKSPLNEDMGDNLNKGKEFAQQAGQKGKEVAQQAGQKGIEIAQQAGEKGGELINQLQQSLNIPDWDSPEGKAKRKQIGEEIGNVFTKVVSVLSESITNREKAAKTHKILHGSSILALILGIRGFLKHIEDIVVKTPTTSWIKNAVGKVTEFIFGVNQDFQDVDLDWSQAGGQFWLKFAITLFILKIVHSMLSKGSEVSQDVGSIWSSIRGLFGRNKKMSEEFKIFENYPWGAKDDPAAPWNEPEFSDDEEEYEPDPDERHDTDHGEGPVDELFGFSRGNKEAKAKEEKVGRAKEEIEKFDFRRLHYMPARNADGDQFKQSKVIRLRGIEQELPTVAELMPILFDSNQGAANASIDSGSRILTGYIPSNWFFIVKNGYINNDVAKENLLSRIDKDDLHEEDGVNEMFDWSVKYQYPDNVETYQKLLDTAQKEGHITAQQANAEFIVAAAKEIAAEFDSLGNDTHWDMYYKEFLTRINKIGSLNLKMNEKDDKWIQKAVNPDHEGYCTPMTKDTCTPPRKALAKRFKAGIDETEDYLNWDYRTWVSKIRPDQFNRFLEMAKEEGIDPEELYNEMKEEDMERNKRLGLTESDEHVNRFFEKVRQFVQKYDRGKPAELDAKAKKLAGDYLKRNERVRDLNLDSVVPEKDKWFHDALFSQTSGVPMDDEDGDLMEGAMDVPETTKLTDENRGRGYLKHSVDAAGGKKALMQVGWDHGYDEYSIYFPQLDFSNTPDQVIRISDDPEDANKVFEVAKNLMNQTFNTSKEWSMDDLGLIYNKVYDYVNEIYDAKNNDLMEARAMDAEKGRKIEMIVKMFLDEGNDPLNDKRAMWNLMQLVQKNADPMIDLVTLREYVYDYVEDDDLNESVKKSKIRLLETMKALDPKFKIK